MKQIETTLLTVKDAVKEERTVLRGCPTSEPILLPEELRVSWEK